MIVNVSTFSTPPQDRPHGQSVPQGKQVHLLQVWPLRNHWKSRRSLRLAHQQHQWKGNHCQFISTFFMMDVSLIRSTSFCGSGSSSWLALAFAASSIISSLSSTPTLLWCTSSPGPWTKEDCSSKALARSVKSVIGSCSTSYPETWNPWSVVQLSFVHLCLKCVHFSGVWWILARAVLGDERQERQQRGNSETIDGLKHF